MKKIILFGDSITAGYKNGEITGALTERIQQELPEFNVINAGIPGETTIEGLKRMERHVIAHRPTYVTIFFGANDVAGQHLVPISLYKSNLEKMLHQIGPEKCLLLTPPYIAPLLHAEDRPLTRVQDYAEAVLALGKELQADTVPLLAEMLALKEPDKLLQVDGLHFSKAGYQFLSQAMVNGLNQKIAAAKKL